MNDSVSIKTTKSISLLKHEFGFAFVSDILNALVVVVTLIFTNWKRTARKIHYETRM